MLDEHLVQTVVHSKDLHCGVTELRVSVLLTPGHSFVLLDRSTFRTARAIGTGDAAEQCIGEGPADYCAGGVVPAGGAVSVPVCLVNWKVQGRPRMPAPSSRLPVPDVSVNFASM